MSRTVWKLRFWRTWPEQSCPPELLRLFFSRHGSMIDDPGHEQALDPEKWSFRESFCITSQAATCCLSALEAPARCVACCSGGQATQEC
eukprot:9499068-Pyramimonas_sp.AAC.2